MLLPDLWKRVSRSVLVRVGCSNRQPRLSSSYAGSFACAHTCQATNLSGHGALTASQEANQREPSHLRMMASQTVTREKKRKKKKKEEKTISLRNGTGKTGLPCEE